MDIFDEQIKKWPATFVSRTAVKDFSGGAISEKYLANLDSSGKGPSGRFRLGRKICYPVANLVSWLRARVTKISDSH